MTVYENIDMCLAQRGISRRQLARMAGIKETTLASCFARRPEHFPLKYGKAIAKVLGVDVDELYSYSSTNILNSPQVLHANTKVQMPRNLPSIEELLGIVKESQEHPETFMQRVNQSERDRELINHKELEAIRQQVDQFFGEGTGYVFLRFVKAYSQLNKAGRERALETLEDIAQIERYTKPDENEIKYKRVPLANLLSDSDG